MEEEKKCVKCGEDSVEKGTCKKCETCQKCGGKPCTCE